MKIKGLYKDVIMKNNEVLKDCGWQPNTIAADCGRFLAALMKKEFQSPPVGIEYLAVGSGSTDDAHFRDRVAGFFEWLNEDPTRVGPLLEDGWWVWAKKIADKEIKFLDTAGIMTPEITNRLEVEVKIAENEPSSDTLNFQEFALIGVDKKTDGTFDTARLFLVNYVSHGPITKDKEMELSRTIKLIFPMKQEEES